MDSSEKKTVVLLGHNVWQERSLELMLRLGGYESYVVNDSHEATNLVKSMESQVHSILLPATGNQRVLGERLDVFRENDVTSSIVLVGMSHQDFEKSPHAAEIRGEMNLSACMIDQLLDCLSQ